MALTDIYAALANLVARQADGSNNDGNNNAGDDVGQADDAYLRITPNSYGDGLGTMPTGLPTPQTVSNGIMDLGPTDQNHPSSFGVNELFDFFGQLLTHDVAEAETTPTPPPVPTAGLGPIPFFRTLSETDGAGVRQQFNEETSFLDLSMVYGNSDAREDLARAELRDANGDLILDGNGDRIQSAKLLLGDDGLLPTIQEVGVDSGLGSLGVLQLFTEPGFGGLPNLAANPNPPLASYETLFYAGDNRANQQPPLIALHTVWAREHNYQVDQLTPYATAEGWTQDQLFEAARAIVEAEWQHIVYEEYVPTLIGTKAGTLLAAYKATHPGTIEPGIINEWTTVAFRFGHDQSSNEYTLLNADGTKVAIDDPATADAFSISLGLAFTLARAGADAPGAGHNAADIDAWIRGISAQYAQEIDGKVADGNREALFGGLGGTVDLEVFDIQRARDHGVWNYNDLRAGLGLSTYTSFDAFAAANGYAVTDARIVALKSVYGAAGIDLADSVVMGLLEKRYADSQLGETFTLLNAIQFDALKGDAFYFEQRLADSPELLAEIKGTTMAEIMDRDSGADHLHLDSFQVAKTTTLGNGNDTKYGDQIAKEAAQFHADNMIGGNGNDKLYGGKGNDTLYGDAGNDKLDGGIGDDFLKGGVGKDEIYGGKGNDHAWGDADNDYITLESGDDWANGGAGNDRIDCGDGNDIALGKEGNDDLNGGRGNDELFGGDGGDELNGEDGDDKCYGGAGNDYILGEKGNDLIVGEGGNDALGGGAGYDTFAFGAGSGKDKIIDFNVKFDKIDLSELAQFDSFADVQAATTTKYGTTIINLGDTDYDGYNDTIELVGVSQKLLKEGNFVLYEEDTPVV